MLHLVRHGRPVVDPTEPASTWELDPAGFDDVWALGRSGRLPARAAWYCSPEPKAIDTAQLLTDSDVGVVDDLREHERGSAWVEDFEATVRASFARPERSAHPGWEPLEACRRRVGAAVRRILDVHGAHEDGGGDLAEQVVLVGHGTAWTLAVSELTGAPPDLERWATLALPDVLTVPATPTMTP